MNKTESAVEKYRGRKRKERGRERAEAGRHGDISKQTERKRDIYI